MNTHRIESIEARPANPGGLPHFEVRCSCGFTFAEAYETTAQIEAQHHIDYMTRKERKR